MKYFKVNGSISKSEFLNAAKKVRIFSSSRGKRYVVKKIEDNTIFINRLDPKHPDEL